MKHRSRQSARSARTVTAKVPLERCILHVLFAVVLALSSVPTAAVRAFAEELAPEVPVEQPAETPGETPTTPDPEPVSEPEPEPVQDPEPQPDPDPEPVPEPAPAEGTATAEEPAIVEAQEPAAPASAPTTRGILRAPAADTVSVTAVGVTSADTPLPDGTYAAPIEVVAVVTGTDITADLPTVTLTRTDADGHVHYDTYVPTVEKWEHIGASWYATVYASNPGTYTSLSVSGGSCTYDGSTAELRGSASFSPQFTIAGLFNLAYVVPVDEHGDEIRDDGGNRIDFLEATSKTVVEAHALKVVISADTLSYTSDPETSKSFAALVDFKGNIIELQPFEPEAGEEHSYVAVLDGFSESSTDSGIPDGIYGVMVFAENESGKRLVDDEGNEFVLVCARQETQDDGTKKPIPDSCLVISNSKPELKVEYPHNRASSTYTPDNPLNARIATVPEKIDFFSFEPEVTITISDLAIDENATKVFGVSLADLYHDPSTAIPGIPCSVTLSTRDNGASEIRIVATCSDGVYDASTVAVVKGAADEAVTAVLKDASGTPLDITHFIVDLEAPQVTAAELGFPPFNLGTDASGAAIVNGAENNGNRIYIVAAERGIDPTSIVLAIDEPHGIRSVEIIDTSNTYAAYLGGFASVLESGNAGLTDASHTGSYDLTVIDHLVDGLEFPDDVTFVITDFAGNQYGWSMLGQGWSSKVDDSSIVQKPNADLHYDLGGDVTDMLHPTLLVPDETDPALIVNGPANRTDAVKPAYARIYSGSQDVSLVLTELNLKYLLGFEGGSELFDPNGYVNGTFAGLDLDRSVLTYTFTPGTDGATPVTTTIRVRDLTADTSNPARFTWKTTFEANGDYEVAGEFTDIARNSSGAQTVEKFTIDTTAPVLTVTYDNDTLENGYCANTRTATITVFEHNFDPDLFHIDVTATGGAQGMAVPAPSAWTDAGDKHTCTVAFTEDGTYKLSVSGEDKAGNQASPYASGAFSIDTEAPDIARYYAHGAAPASSFDADSPVAELPEATGIYDDGSGPIYFYSHAITVDAKVQDRSFDESATKVYLSKDGTETEQSIAWERQPDEVGANGYELYRMTVPYTADGDYLAPHVVSTDLAQNTSDNDTVAQAVRIVVDLEPPEVKVDVDTTPSAQGTSGSTDSVNFYNQTTTLTVTVSDAHKLRAVEIDDPDGLYNISAADAAAEGKDQVVLTLALKDGTDAQDGEFDRPIKLIAEDLAGNKRVWTIDHEGTVTLDKIETSAANAAINGGTEHPVSLIQDTVAPIVSLSGATAGAYYNSPQAVTASVTEFCMDYLQLFEGGRAIVTVTTRPGMAGGATSTTTIPASAFTGSRPDYSYLQSFDADGHYSLTAQFSDFAGNPSNTATIGEFTIDMTPPMISVEFDNNNARNAKYYNAPRTATITVTEHNFDSSLININTTGAIGGWTTNGDDHICTVYFGEGSAHTLTVNGSDLAGNQGNEFTEPEFVVDLTAPTITIAGTAQRLGYLTDNASEGLHNAYLGTLEDYNAYNGVVVPTITYSDNEVLSAADLAFTIVGSKNGDEVAVETYMSDEAKEMTTTFRDLGYVGPDAGDGSNWDEFYVDDYDVDADDIYTLSATMTDQAGNEAEAELVFSVNRYGSNYVVSLVGLDTQEEARYESTGMLSEAPTIVVREINVSGVNDRDENGNLVADNHHVQKEFANATSAIALSDGPGAGYGLVAIDNKDQEVGWSEYIYTIHSGNFGEGSDSDNNDRGQGAYRVNVMSDDRASNANSTAAYWGSDAVRAQAAAMGSTTEFVLDELAPVIDDLDLPEHFSAGAVYEASFHVTDDITSGNQVQVFIDGEELAASELNGPSGGAGTYTFSIEGRAFDWSRDVRIVVTDYAGRVAEAGNGTWFWQSSFIPEGLAATGVAAVAVAGAVAARKRKAAQEPELPE